MTRIVLELSDAAFFELYGITEGYFAMNDGTDGTPLTDLMKQINEQCVKAASPEARAAMAERLAEVAPLFTEDSADLYLAKAGIRGLMEKADEKT